MNLNWSSTSYRRRGRAAVLVTVAAATVLSATGSAAVSRVARTPYIYWTANGVTLWEAPLGGTGRAHLLATGSVPPGGIGMPAVSTRFLYWGNGGAIARANPDGSRIDRQFITGANVAIGVAVTSRYIYWANNATQSDGKTKGPSSIGRANLNGSDANQNFIAGAHNPDAVVVGSGYIYWANDSSIGRAKLDGTDANQNFIADKQVPAGLAVTSKYIYWTNERGTTIGRARLNGTGVNQHFVTGASELDALTINSGYLYWANYGNGTIGRAKLDGSHVKERFRVIRGRPNGVAILS